MISPKLEEDRIFIEMVDRITNQGVCSECDQKLPWKPGQHTMKPWHCSRKCYSRYLWRLIKKNGLLK